MDTQTLIVGLLQYANPAVGFFVWLIMLGLTTAFVIPSLWKRILPFALAIGLSYLNNFLVLKHLNILGLGAVAIAIPILCGFAVGWLTQLGYKFALKLDGPK